MAFPTTRLLDDFNRANTGPPLSASWANVGNGWQVIGNQARPSAATNCINYWLTSYAAPQEAWCTVATLSGATGVFARMKEPGASVDFYLVRVTATNIIIGRVDNSVETVLSATAGTYSSGIKIGIRCHGSTIQAWSNTGSVWSLVASVVDATYPAGGFIGLFGTAMAAAVGNFGGGVIRAGRLFGERPQSRLAGGALAG